MGAQIGGKCNWQSLHLQLGNIFDKPFRNALEGRQAAQIGSSRNLHSSMKLTMLP